MSVQSETQTTHVATEPAASVVATEPTQTLPTITVPDGQRYIARVKWFDNSLSYGFATIMSGEHSGRDIFVHQSNILTLAQGIYRTLRMGEYIEFNLEENNADSHRYQAIAVTGPCAGQLMCESNPRRPRVFQQNEGVEHNNNVQLRQTTVNQVQQQGKGRQRRGYHNQQMPIQVVVEYPNANRQQRRQRKNTRNNLHSNQQSAAANIAATLAAGNTQ